MAYHILSIDSPQCFLSCKDGQVTCRVDGEDAVRTIPLEDVASIIITSFSATVHSHLLLEAAKHGVALIICEAFTPVSLVLPANRCTDTVLTRAQVLLKKRERDSLWQRTVDAKCRNQLLLARTLLPESTDPRLDSLASYAEGKHPQRESLSARLYWALFGHAIGQPQFTRERSLEGVNSLLNYGYAVLLSTTLQKLFGVGLDPTFGIFHVTREHSTPLAYDLMEPFRPCVDARVAQWVHRHPDPAQHTVSREFRAWVTAFPLEAAEYLDMTLEIRGVIEGCVRGFRKAVIENRPALYKPWTPKNTKWAGF